MFDKSKSKKFAINQGQTKKFDIAKQPHKAVVQETNDLYTNYESTNIARVIRKIESQVDFNFDDSSRRLLEAAISLLSLSWD